jgi:hypothetical protein
MITQKLIHQSIQNVERRQRKIKYEEWKHKKDASYFDFVLNPIEYIEADMGCRFDGKLKDISEGWSWWTKGKNCIKYRDFYTKAKFIEAVNSRDTELIFKACTKRGLKDLLDVCLSRLSKMEQDQFSFKAQRDCNWRGWIHKVTKDDLVKSLMEMRRYLISIRWSFGPKINHSARHYERVIKSQKTKSKLKAWKNNYIL